jgi:hypothetical protein
VYKLAWDLYMHEDSLMQQRHTVYVGVQAALVAAVGLVCSTIVRVDQTGTTPPSWAITSALAFSAGMALFGLIFASYWRAATAAGHGYVNLRWASVRAVEELLDLPSPARIADLEGRYKSGETEPVLRRKTNRETWQPFRDSSLAELQLPRQPVLGGRASQDRTTITFLILWTILLVGSIVGLVILNIG